MNYLLVIDVQKQFNTGGYEKCLEFIEKHRDEYDKVVATVFKQDRSVNGNYAKLKYDGCMDASENDIEFQTDMTVIKHGYGLPGNFFSSKDRVDVIGCETDACVLATCFNLWDAGIDFQVLWDYVYTSADIAEIELWKIYKRNFGVNGLKWWQRLIECISDKKADILKFMKTE